MLSSIQIHNKIVENRAKLDAAEKSFNAAEGDVKDVYRDTINQIKGENKALDEQLAEALEAFPQRSLRRAFPAQSGVQEPCPCRLTRRLRYGPDHRGWHNPRRPRRSGLR